MSPYSKMHINILVVISVVAIYTVNAFSSNTFSTPLYKTHPIRYSSSPLWLANSKGFGKSDKKTTKITNKFDDDDTSNDTNDSNFSAADSKVNISRPPDYSSIPTAGEEALARLRRQKVEQRNEELLQIRSLKEQDKLIASSPDAAVIPEVVAQRMGRRMLPFVGIPLFGGMGAFVGFWYFATYKDVEFQPALVAFSTIAILAVGLLGITYSVMSASWDVEEEGSFLGTEQFSKNVQSIKDGLKRTRENAILREKMASLPDEEIEAALNSLEKKEKMDATKKMSLKERLEKDLE